MLHSKLVDALGVKYSPVAIVWTNEKPEKALSFKEGKWGCVMWMLAHAAKGGTAAFDEKTCGCWGGGVGLGFGNQYLNFPGGIDCFSYFLSIGNQSWEQGRAVGKQLESVVGRDFLDNFLHGEGYMKTPELVKQFVDSMPIMKIPAKYALLKPLKEVDPVVEPPSVVIFLADPDQLSALVVLANYGREGNENVITPFAAGCQAIGIFPYQESLSEIPRAVIGLTDISARNYIKKQLNRNLLSFTVPWKMYQELENHVEGSFLRKKTWRQVRE